MQSRHLHMNVKTIVCKLSFALGASLASLLSLTAHAQVFTESGDAGASLATANALPGFGRIDVIHGSLSSGFDADLYRIWVNDPSIFSATTVGGTTIDTDLFLLNWNGTPAYLNDDDAGGLSLQSTLSASHFATPLSIGFYYLGVTAAGFEPENTSGELLFAPFILSSTETRGAADGLSPNTLSDFTSLWSSGESGSYTLKLAGVGAVPEPSTYGLIGALGLVTAIAARRRRKLS
jgi:PEP-CTERM motif